MFNLFNFFKKPMPKVGEVYQLITDGPFDDEIKFVVVEVMDNWIIYHYIMDGEPYTPTSFHICWDNTAREIYKKV